MSFNVEVTDKFKRRAKILLKKYASLKQELETFVISVKETPDQGTPIGKNCYKIRLGIKSKDKGKSAGARIITHVHISETTVYLLTIYDKSVQESINDKEIKELLNNI